ncbi:cell division cycle and apoptosis regulator protein 1 isoform X2 [Oryzias melastigma]|uniref:cell division cycle and apoptosis regulator protein 1 isoform X2 n=1 Tax=Oryzias melastigma TaxID=30732 RepID=UPI000CF7F9C0|nr:cell division cycle and apoptosis regulator protein 1 isoform X2 [Oryzias melastigma]
MHHGSGSQNMQRQLQKSKSVSGSEAEEQQQPSLAATQQQTTVAHPQSPVTTFSSAASPSAPQSPNYQIIMSRSPVTGQNVNITLQNVGQMVTANQQITLTPLPIQNPASPGFQHTAPQWRFEHGPSSYIQVTSPVPQPIQPQSPTQHSPIPIQGVTRPGAPSGALGVCGQSPTRFVEAGMLVRQINLGSPSGGGHFVYQEGTGLAQIAPATSGQVQLTSPGTPGSVRERRLSQPHSQTGGTIHHLGPQSPVATGTNLSALGNPGHITTSNLPPQISSIIQGQLARPMIFEKTAQGVVAGVGSTATASFSIPSSIPPTSPSLSSPPQGVPSNPLTSTTMTVGTVKKQAAKKLEELAPSTPEIAQLRKQCLDHHTKKMESLKEVFKEYLIELFFLQHLQGNMMDYLTFKKKPCVPLYTYLRQSDLDLEDDDEEEEQSEVINDEGHQGTASGSITNPGDMDAFKRQQSAVQTGGMPPTPQAVQIAGQKQNQQQYDPSKGPPVQNAASLHTPPPQLPGRLSQGTLPLAGLSMTLSQQAQLVENSAPPSGQLQAQVKVQAGGPVLATVNPHTQLQAQLQQQMQPGIQLQLQQQSTQAILQSGQATVALARPVVDPNQTVQRVVTNSVATTSVSSAPLCTPSSAPASHSATSLRTLSSNISPSTQSKVTGTNGISTVKIGGFAQSNMQSSQEGSQDKQIEQAKLESQVHQRISELRKEGQWSASRLPKLVEASRPKSQWDYLLEEMQWMAADFAQERRWKEAAAKKLVRTCARYHQEREKSEERLLKERETHLRHIASTVAREVEFFWSNIDQVVEIKLQFEIYEKKLKALSLQKAMVSSQSVEEMASKEEGVTPAKKLKSSFSFVDEDVTDEESTIEEQEGVEEDADHKTELLDLAKDAEMPLDSLMKQYAGAYADGFEWPQPGLNSDEDDMEETQEMECTSASPHEAVLIDSLLSVDQYHGSDKSASSDSGKPGRDIAEVAASTELILPKGSFRTTSSNRSSAPFLLHGMLRDYQQVGVDWLVNLYKKHLNGILADETGLGKTVQTVAYMAHLAGQEGIWGPHLVVVRTCKLLSWELEFKRWCPGLKILLYLGNGKERRSKRMWWDEPNGFHVCLTSYKLFMKDQSHFLRKKWRHLVLDEVQLIKNTAEKHWEVILALRSEQRILLINNPLQNTLKELWTMIHFLLPGITRPYSDFPVKAGTDQNQDYCHKLVIRLHRVIQPFILRRSKRDVEKQLPKKYEHILKCRLSNRQKSLYEDILTQPGAQEALKTGHFVSVLQVLMQLQRVCNHPELVAPRETSSSYSCSSLEYNVPSLVLDAIEKDPSKTANFPIFDLINNENRLTRYQTEEAVPNLKITQQLIEEIYTGPEPAPRPRPCPLKPMKLFQPVQYGTKPEGRLTAFTNAVQRPPTSSPTTSTSPSTTSQVGQTRGKSPVTTGAATNVSHGGDVKIAQLTNIAGTQNRISQPETPVTLQFQGNKFTLSPSQLRQLTTGQPLQLQGNILQIVSAPGQPIIRPQGSMVMQAMPQAGTASNATVPASTPHPGLSTSQQGSSVTANATSASSKVTNAAHGVSLEPTEEKSRLLKERLRSLFEANERRCSRRVLYGSDLVQACTLISEPAHTALTAGGWRWVGRESCVRAQRTCVGTTSALQSDLLSVEERLGASSSLIQRLSCVVPPAVASPPHLYAANPSIPFRLEQKSNRRQLQESAAPYSESIHRLASKPLISCPDLQLMQMDSGKLEALAILLQKLRSESRRVLIFTQMLKMLDILEAFLDYRQLTYVRIDESLTLDERQENMKKFNRKRQLFCSILTNRCCTAVGTMVDADTFIFYDTDLNPSMDALTQEWCDKIGRSKDIHIYRLESGNSIEEKLLKNGTKDLIREVAAQGTDYTLAFLTQRTIQDLFEVEAGSGVKVQEFVVLHQEPSASEAISPKVARPYIQALQSINLDAPEEKEHQQEGESANKEAEELEHQHRDDAVQIEELNAVMEQLTPIERYAVHYLEYLHISDDEVALKKQLKSAKRAWELQQLQKLTEEKEEQKMTEGEEDLFTYTREDAYNMEYVFEAEDGHTEIMPLWTPPTPPQDDNDIYIDSVMMLMYDTTPMPESKLPPIYIRKEHKRLKMDPSAARKKKKGHGETVIPPRSLFEKASMLKVRREVKDQKKNFSLKQQAPFAKPLPSLVKPAMEAGQDNPEWLISEDWALLQAVKQLLELPLNLTIVSPAHTPNWDLVSDVVNSCSRIYRSPKQCRNRYENVIIPREEGKLVYEANPKKKTKSIYKSKNSRPLRTCQIYTQDDNTSQIQLYNSRFELMKIIASKRSPPIKPLLGMNPFQKNPKHASVLAESGISYDKPLPPIQVASQRAERIAKEKKALAEQQKAQQLAQQQAGAPQAGAAPGQTQAPAAGQVPQASAVTGAAAVPNAAVLAGAIKNAAVGSTIQAATVGGNVIVNTVAGVPPSPFQANKRLASSVIPGTLSPSGTAGAQVVHAQQRVTAAAAPTEVVAIATGQGVRAVTPVTASAVVSTSLSPVQSQTRPLVPQVASATGMQLSQKTLTPAQIQLLRQQHAQQQQQQQQQPPQQPPQQQLYSVPHQLPQPQQALLSQPPVALPTSLSLSNPQQTAQITVSYPTPRSSHQQQTQPQKQRVFTGVVNKLHDTFGFVDEDVFFQLSAVKGKTPQVGDRVLVEAVYNPNMPFKWNAQRIQTLPQLANQSHQQQPQPLPQASPQLGSLYNEPGMQLRYTDMHSTGDNRQNSQPQGPNMMKPAPSMLQSLPPPTTFSVPSQAPPPSLLQAQLSAASLAPLLQNPPQPLLPQPPPKDVFTGGLLQPPVRMMPQPQPVRRIEPPPRFPTRNDRVPELILRPKEERRDRDRDRRRSRERSPTRKRSRDRSPRRERSPRRPRRVVPRYTVQFSKFSLDGTSCDLMELRRRYQSLYIPSDFFNAVFTWVDAFPLTRPFQFSNACNFHILHKEVDSFSKNTAVLDPPDVNHTYSAKVMLLANPSLEELYHKSCALAEDPQELRESFQHPARLIKFLVGMRGKDEAMAIGGHWSPSLDGADPEQDPSVLIKTAIRCCKALTGIDLSLCTQWYRFAEIRYHRPEETHKGRTVPAHVETVVLFLPDVWHCLPTRSEWEVLSRRLREQLAEKLSAERKEADGEQDEEEKDEESKDNSTPTHWAKLDPKSMKVNDLRKELDCRSLSSKGLKSQLIARLTKQLKVEEQVEESKEPEKIEVKVVEEEEPPRAEDDKEEEERKKQEELERQRRERRYILPDEPTILVQPNWAAKNGKFDCSVMSLSVLLDYRLEDNKEHSFEVSLFAELFNEMLQRDFGYRIYKALAALPVKDDKKEKKIKKDMEKKEAEKREIKKEKEDETDEPSAKKSREDEEEKKKYEEKTVKKEESRDEDENEDDSSTANPEEYDPLEADDADDDEDDDKDDDDSNDRDRKDRRDDHRSSKERSSKDKEKKQMVTYNKELLMAFVYFDQSHCGYLLERDVEEILYTLGLHLSRAQIKKLLNKPVVKESFHYRKLTDRGKDEAPPSFNEAQIESITGNRGLLSSAKAHAQSESSQSGNLIVYNGAMVDVGSMMQKLEKTEKAREEIEQKLMLQDAKMEDDSKVKAQLEQANKAFSQELEEVKSSLSQTERTLGSVEEQRALYRELLIKSAHSLTSTVRGLLDVLKKDQEVDESTFKDCGDIVQTPQTNGSDE